MANPLSYPGLGQVRDSVISTALRFLWDTVYKVQSIAAGPTEGTLSPDMKPRLGLGDAGTLFYSTDFNRLYRWTGSAWQDDPTAPSRFQVTYFAAPPEPGVGWIPCDGRTTLCSTSSATTTYFQVPVIPVSAGNQAYIRV